MNIENKILDKLMEYNSSRDSTISKIYYERIAKEISIEIKLLNAELEAKVYAYEKIISNSNFKTILEDNETKKKTKKRGENNE